MAERDPRAELRRRLETGQLSALDAERVLAALDELDGDRAALLAAERPGSATAEESRAVVEALAVPDAEVREMMRRLGLDAAA